jgi:hypothetical protein
MKLKPPRKSRSAYHFFCNAISIDYKISRGDSKTKKGEVISDIADMWKRFKLNPEPYSVLKRIYIEVERDKVRYQKEMCEWHSSSEKERSKLSKELKIREEYREYNFIKDIKLLFDEGERNDIIQTDLSSFFI